MYNPFKAWDNCVTKDGVATLDCIPTIFLNLISALLAFAGLTALILFILGSFKFMNASGDPKKLEGAKNSYSYAILGLTIVLLSFLIIRIIVAVTGVECITSFGFGCK